MVFISQVNYARKNQEDTKAKQVAFGEESADIEHSFIFKIHPALHSQCKPAGMLVDTGATSRAVARTLIGGGGGRVYIHIFGFCPTNFFRNQLHFKRN